MSNKFKFVLVGKSNSCERVLSKEFIMQRTNKDRLDYVKDLVKFHFGGRALAVVNETTLVKDMYVYPQFFAAGWVIDNETNEEFVLIDHGKSMKDARSSLMDAFNSINWHEYSTKI